MNNCWKIGKVTLIIDWDVEFHFLNKLQNLQSDFSP